MVVTGGLSSDGITPGDHRKLLVMVTDVKTDAGRNGTRKAPR